MRVPMGIGIVRVLKLRLLFLMLQVQKIGIRMEVLVLFISQFSLEPLVERVIRELESVVLQFLL